jgi:hypothetical protein
MIATLALTLAAGLVAGSRSPGGDLPAFAAPGVGKPKCHYVTKKVHGKPTRVKVCTKPKPTPTVVPPPDHLIDAGGYLWVDGAGDVYVSSGSLPSGANGWVSELSSTGARLATFRS